LGPHRDVVKVVTLSIDYLGGVEFKAPPEFAEIAKILAGSAFVL
jgi:hypothetical protein